MKFFHNFAKKMPGLNVKLRQAGMLDEPEDYLKKITTNSIFAALGISCVIFTFLPSPAVFLFFFILFPIMFFYFLRYVDTKIDKIRKKVDQEIIFAGRFLIIGLESGVPIYKIFEDLEKNYGTVGVYFGEILNKVYLGTSMEDAINETLLSCPSSNLRRILWQVLNSLKTGTEVNRSLNSIIDQIVKEQEISVKEYGKRLNPMAMFYMMIALIIPSLGITMFVVLATFIGLNVSMTILVIVACLLGFVQFMFLLMIKSSRPAIST